MLQHNGANFPFVSFDCFDHAVEIPVAEKTVTRPLNKYFSLVVKWNDAWVLFLKGQIAYNSLESSAVC